MTILFYLTMAACSVGGIASILMAAFWFEEPYRELSDGSDNQHEHITEYIP